MSRVGREVIAREIRAPRELERVDSVSRRRHPLCIDAGNVFGCGARLTYFSRFRGLLAGKRPLRRA